MADFRKPAPEKEYIITERQLKNACDVITFHGQPMGAKDLGEEIRSRPYTSASSDKVLEKLNIAIHDDEESHERFNGFTWIRLIDIDLIVEKFRQQTKERE